MNANKIDLRNRWADIPEMVRILANDNPVVERCIAEYVHGRIVTKEECLCQIIMALSRTWDEQRCRAIEAALRAPTPVILRKDDNE